MADESTSDKLCNASASGNLHGVLSLLHEGANVNGLNRYNRTALQVVNLRDESLVKALLDARADPNVPDPSCSLTVMHDAARAGYLETVRALLDGQADVNLLDKWGNLPLHLAAKEGHLEVVKLIITQTENPRAANTEGFTAWHLAQPEVRKYLDQYFGSN